MSSLYISIEETNEGHILEPSNEYIIGRHPTCDIPLPDHDISEYHAKFMFSQISGTWYIYELSNKSEIFIDNQVVTSNYPIQDKTRISLNNKVHLFASPTHSTPVSSQEHTPSSSPVPAHPSTYQQPVFNQPPSLSISDTQISPYQSGNFYRPPRSIKREEFNKNCLDRRDPSEFLGYHLVDQYKVAIIYPFEPQNREKINEAIEDLYSYIIQRLQSGVIHHKTSEIIDYVDAKHHPPEAPRRYIRVEEKTTRNTNITTLFRFYENGDNLYLAIDSYILGRISWKVLWAKIVASFVTFPLLLAVFPLLSASVTLLNFLGPLISILSTIVSILLFLVPFMFLWSVWSYFIRGWLTTQKFFYSLRVAMPGYLVNSSFDEDDYSIYLKSLLPLAIKSIEKILKEKELLAPSIQETLQNLAKDIRNKPYSINVSGSNFINSVVGGSNNQLSNSSSQIKN